MERVFWMLLDKDGALVKNMMDEFHKSHRHSLPENHRKLVLILPHLFFLLHPTCKTTAPSAMLTLFSTHFIFSCQRFCHLEQCQMKASWRSWGDAGRKTSICCVHIQLLLYGITITVLTAQGSTGVVYLFSYINASYFWYQDMNQQVSLVFKASVVTENNDIIIHKQK